MIIYGITQMDAHQGFIRHWARSKTDLCRVKAKVRAMYRANGNQKDFNGWGGPHKYEMGKGKDSIVEFLNLHARFDNG